MSASMQHSEVLVHDETGVPLRGVTVVFKRFSDVGAQDWNQEKITNANGIVSFTAEANVAITTGFLGISQSEPLTLQREDQVQVEITLDTEGLSLDQAFADESAIDVTKPFFPLGLQPQPGSVFYFTHKEAFSKPGARLQIYVQTAQSPSDQLDLTIAPIASARSVALKQSLPHVLSWDYWNGRNWVTRKLSNTKDITSDSPTDFTGSGIITDLTVPFDMEPIKINDQEGLWMRVRLVSGSYGFVDQIATGNSQTAFSFIVPQPPVLSKFLLGYIWQNGPFHPEHILAYNDFQYEDRTEDAKWPGQTFQPFKPVGDATPALYLGFDKKLPVDRLGILFDIMEQRGDTKGPALLWQYWDGNSWQDIDVEDETQNFRLPGIVSLIGPSDSELLARFDEPLHWLRGRLKEDGPPGEPVFNNIYLNAVWAVQHQTIADEPIGTSTGQSNQVFDFRQIPVLSGAQIEVREAGGLRANVEWRLIGLEVFGGDASAIASIEKLLGTEDIQTDVQWGDLRLKRDRNKRVTEVWVRWHEQRHFFFSSPGDRHFVVDQAQGWLMFGDGTRGKVPPPGAAILARQYRTGGGRAGNVAARVLSQLIGPIGGVEEVFNPLVAEGGADGESLKNYASRAPMTLRHRGRAIAPADYEALAFEASSAVAIARAIPTRNPSGRPISGWMTLLIIPQSQDSRPWPSFGLREQVRKFIEARAPADVAAAHQIYITGPDYFSIDIAATLAPVDPAEAGAVEGRARQALGEFLHPLHGGLDGHGWELGRDVFLSDVASVLERVPGVDYVEDLALLVDGILQGVQVAIADDRMAVAGDIRLKLKAAER